MDLSTFTNLQSEWEHASRSKRASTLLATLVTLEHDLAAFDASSLADLVRGGSVATTRRAIEPWRITAALIRQFHLDKLVGLALLVRLTPGLLAIARSLDWGRSPPWQDAEALAVDVVSTAWEVLDRYGGTSVAYPERTVLRTMRHQLEAQRAVSRRRSMKEELAGDHAAEFCDPNPIPVLDELALALRLHQPQLPLRDLQLIYSHRVLGLTFPELAAASGTSVSALEQRSFRAEAALCG